MLRKLARSTKVLLARSRAATRFAVRIREHANSVVRVRLGDSAFVSESGEQWLLEAFAPSCRRFVDVGANAGEWTATLLRHARPGVEGVLFEPARPALERLRARFGTLSTISIVEAAASDAVGEQIFFEEPDAGGRSSLLAGFSDRSDTRPHRVPVTTLDLALDRWGDEWIDILKVDAEGYDLHVLRGATRALEAHRFGIVQFEYNLGWMRAGSTLGGALRLLAESGYTTFLLKPQGLFEIPYDIYGEYFGDSNYVAFAPRRLGEADRYRRGEL